MSNGSDITKAFDAIWKVIKNNGRTTKLTNVKSRGNTFNLHPVIMKLLRAEKTERKKYEFDEALNIFDEIDFKLNELKEHKLRPNNNKKCLMLVYLKTIKNEHVLYS